MIDEQVRLGRSPFERRGRVSVVTLEEVPLLSHARRAFTDAVAVSLHCGVREGATRTPFLHRR